MKLFKEESNTEKEKKIQRQNEYREMLNKQIEINKLKKEIEKQKMYLEEKKFEEKFEKHLNDINKNKEIKKKKDYYKVSPDNCFAKMNRNNTNYITKKMINDEDYDTGNTYTDNDKNKKGKREKFKRNRRRNLCNKNRYKEKRR